MQDLSRLHSLGKSLSQPFVDQITLQNILEQELKSHNNPDTLITPVQLHTITSCLQVRKVELSHDAKAAITAHLSSSRGTVRSAATYAVAALNLSQMKSTTIEELNTFLQIVCDRDICVREAALTGIAQLALGGLVLPTSILQSLTTSLEDSHVRIRILACNIAWLCAIQNPHESVPPLSLPCAHHVFVMLCQRMFDSHAAVKQTVCRLLHTLPNITEQLASQSILHDGVTELRNLPGKAGREILCDPVRGVLFYALEDEASIVRVAALDALTSMCLTHHRENLPRPFVDTLIDMCNDEILIVRLHAVFALTLLAHSVLLTTHHVATIVRMFQESNCEARRFAYRLLSNCRIDTFTNILIVLEALIVSANKTSIDLEHITTCAPALAKNNPTEAEPVVLRVLEMNILARSNTHTHAYVISSLFVLAAVETQPTIQSKIDVRLMSDIRFFHMKATETEELQPIKDGVVWLQNGMAQLKSNLPWATQSLHKITNCIRECECIERTNTGAAPNARFFRIYLKSVAALIHIIDSDCIREYLDTSKIREECSKLLSVFIGVPECDCTCAHFLLEVSNLIVSRQRLCDLSGAFSHSRYSRCDPLIEQSIQRLATASDRKLSDLDWKWVLGGTIPLPEVKFLLKSTIAVVKLPKSSVEKPLMYQFPERIRVPVTGAISNVPFNRSFFLRAILPDKSTQFHEIPVPRVIRQSKISFEEIIELRFPQPHTVAPSAVVLEVVCQSSFSEELVCACSAAQFVYVFAKSPPFPA
eukprot:c15883_g1_i1.p1 GENE.c15883_g1_i1~~c15883_g1_i1.p1  ORF type:complete len:762 (+),score=196.04 c15883_g1_i1:22-2307(+)